MKISKRDPQVRESRKPRIWFDKQKKKWVIHSYARFGHHINNAAIEFAQKLNHDQGLFLEERRG